MYFFGNIWLYNKYQHCFPFKGRSLIGLFFIHEKIKNTVGIQYYINFRRKVYK